jgi:thiol-disulfide isomerase/thioredoxin
MERVYSNEMRPLVVCLAACGPKVVGGDAIRPDAGDVDAGDTGYPAGPYGVTEGSILANMTFAGYVAPAPESGLGEYRESVTLADLRLLGHRYLLFNVAALWCVPCQQEARELPGDFAEWSPLGGGVASVLKEDESFEPATRAHLDQWIRSYATTYTMLHDPFGQIDFVLAPNALPMNLIIDLDTMAISSVRQGDDPEFFDLYEARLRAEN